MKAAQVASLWTSGLLTLFAHMAKFELFARSAWTGGVWFNPLGIELLGLLAELKH